jgi:hypothetical protein
MNSIDWTTVGKLVAGGGLLGVWAAVTLLQTPHAEAITTFCMTSLGALGGHLFTAPGKPTTTINLPPKE